MSFASTPPATSDDVPLSSRISALRALPETTALVYCSSFVSLGWGIALAGPSILQLSAATSSPVSSVGYIVGLRSLAYLAGGFMGFLFDRVPGHLLIGAALAVGGAATAAVPSCRSLGALAAALISQGFFLCIIDAGANVMLLWLLEGRASMHMWLQALHFCFALGALCAPLALRAGAGAAGAGGPTLLPDGSEVVVEVAGAYDAAWYACGVLCLVNALLLVAVLPPAKRRKGGAEKAAAAEAAASAAAAKIEAASPAASPAAGALLSGASASPASPPLAPPGLLLSTAAAPAWDEAALGAAAAPPPSPPLPPALDAATQRGLARQTWGVVLNVSALFFFYVGCEVGVGLFLTAFAVLSVGLPEASAQLLTAAFWGAITAGRLLAVPLSARLAPETMMSLDVLGALVALAALIALQYSAGGLWLAVVLFGLCMASIYPTGVAILEAFVPLEGKHTTALVIGGSAGEWIFPLIISSFFTSHEGGGAIAMSAADAEFARWAFLGINALCVLGMAAAYVLLRRLGPALALRRSELGLARA